MISAAAASDVMGTVLPPTQDVKPAQTSKGRSLPVTTSSSEQYIAACARSNKKASLYDPLTTLFQAEKLPPIANESIYTDESGLCRPTFSALRSRQAQISQDNIEDLIYESSLNRIRSKACIGAFVAEAGDWAATTTWEPVFAPPRLDTDIDKESGGGTAASFDDSEPWFEVMKSLVLRQERMSDIYVQRPVYVEFITRIEIARRKHLYPIIWEAKSSNIDESNLDPHTREALAVGGRDLKHLLFWHLSVTSRNPAVQPPVPGAVRAIIEPFVKKWVDEIGMPAVWLEAGNVRARDVYGYLGFRVVDEIVVGKDEHGNGIKTWCMIYTKST